MTIPAARLVASASSRPSASNTARLTRHWRASEGNILSVTRCRSFARTTTFRSSTLGNEAGADGEMSRFARKPSGEIERRRVGPGGIGFERDLYTIPDQVEGSDQALEDGLFRLVDDFDGKAMARTATIVGNERPSPRELGRTLIKARVSAPNVWHWAPSLVWG